MINDNGSHYVFFLPLFKNEIDFVKKINTVLRQKEIINIFLTQWCLNYLCEY